MRTGNTIGIQGERRPVTWECLLFVEVVEVISKKTNRTDILLKLQYADDLAVSSGDGITNRCQ